MKHPDASFPSGLSTIETAIVPSGSTAAGLTAKPDGSGPYQFASQMPNESITLKRNAGYFAGKPGVATLEFRIIPDDQSMVSALRTGAVDAAIFSDPVTAKTATSSSVTIDKVGSLQYHVLQLRAASPVLSNVNTRLAIQCAISRQDVVDTAALGAGTITGPITSPSYRSNTADQPCPTQNLAKARQYLAKAGQPNGFTLNLITSQGLYASAVDEAQAVQAQLGQIGIKVNVQTLSASAYVTDWLGGNFEAAIAENAGNIDPNTMYARYFTTGGTFSKVAGYSSPTLNKLFAQGIATTDVAQRQEIYQQISDQLVDNAVWVWLYTPEEYIALNTSVTASTPAPTPTCPCCGRPPFPDAVPLGQEPGLLPQHDTTARHLMTYLSAFARHPVTRRVAEAVATLLGVTILTFVLLRVVPGNQITAQYGTAAGNLTPRRSTRSRPTTGLTSRWSSSTSTGSAACSPATSASTSPPVRASVDDRPGAAQHDRAGRACRSSSAWSSAYPAGCSPRAGREGSATTRRSSSACSPYPSRRSCWPPPSPPGWRTSSTGTPTGRGTPLCSPIPASTWSRCCCPPWCSGSASPRRCCRPRGPRSWPSGPRTTCAPPAPRACPQRRLQFRHILRNALIPVVTMSGLQFGFLLGGAIVAEQIFSIPGIGRQVLLGLGQKEYAVVQSTVLIIAAMFVLVNLATDLIYRLVDPKVRVR